MPRHPWVGHVAGLVIAATLVACDAAPVAPPAAARAPKSSESSRSAMISCAPGFTRCGQRCEDLATSTRSCGGCDQAAQWGCLASQTEPLAGLARARFVCAWTVSGRATCRSLLEAPGPEETVFRDRPELAAAKTALSGERVAQVVLGEAGGCARRLQGGAFCWDVRADSSLKYEIAAWSEVAQLVAGVSDACALHRDASVSCLRLPGWQAPLSAQDPVPQLIPARVEGITDAVSVAVGGRSGAACAVHQDLGVSCWGRSASAGQEPRRVPGLEQITDLSLDDDHTCAVDRAGHVRCWGTLTSPVARMPRASRSKREVLRVVSDGDQRCQVRADGRRTCERLSARRASAPKGPHKLEGLTQVRQVVTSRDYACALRDSGGEGDGDGGDGSAGATLLCWGLNYQGQLGEGGQIKLSDDDAAVWPPISLQVPEVTHLALDEYGGCALSAPDQVWCWGRVSTGRVTSQLREPWLLR